MDKTKEIKVPRVKYEVVAKIDMETAFTGEVTPIPTVLIHYLSHLELRIISVIMEDTYRYGECDQTVKELARRLCLTPPSVSHSLNSLRKRELMIESPNGLRGAGRIRKLNFKTIQHLCDLLEGEDPATYSRIGNAIRRKKSLMNVTKEDILKAYDKYVLPPEHDPAEEEEYD